MGVYAEAATLSLTPVQRQRLERRVLLPRMVYGSVEKGQQLGSIEFYLDGVNVKSVPLLAAEDVAADSSELSLWQKIQKFIIGLVGVTADL